MAKLGSALALVLPFFLACVVENNPPPAAPPAPAPSATSGTAPAPPAPPAPEPKPAPPAPTLPPPAPPAPAPSSSPAPAPAASFTACTKDADCVAVDPPGCCKTGSKEAVAASQTAAYEASVKCNETHPMCPQIMVRETRVPECDHVKHQCEMVAPADVQCGGFVPNPHRCPAGWRCPPSKMPDVASRCVKP